MRHICDRWTVSPPCGRHCVFSELCQSGTTGCTRCKWTEWCLCASSCAPSGSVRIWKSRHTLSIYTFWRWCEPFDGSEECLYSWTPSHMSRSWMAFLQSVRPCDISAGQSSCRFCHKAGTSAFASTFHGVRGGFPETALFWMFSHTDRRRMALAVSTAGGAWGDSAATALFGTTFYTEDRGRARGLSVPRDAKGDFPETSFPGNFCHTGHKEKASCGPSCVSSIPLSNENRRYNAHRRTASLCGTLFFSAFFPALHLTPVLSPHCFYQWKLKTEEVTKISLSIIWRFNVNAFFFKRGKYFLHIQVPCLVWNLIIPFSVLKVALLILLVLPVGASSTDFCNAKRNTACI